MNKKPQRLPHLQSVIKRLFALCGNQCAFPNCPEVIVDISGTMLGKVAHIHAAEPGGSRYDDTMTDEQRRSEENLFIVCGKHHDIIDDKKQTATYTPEVLKRYKSDHEARFKRAERQLLEKFIDSTQINQPTHPKHLKALAEATNWPTMHNDPDQITGVRQFIDKLKEVPLSEREFALKLAERMKRRNVSELPTDDVMGAFSITSNELKRRMKILEHHRLGDIDQGTGYQEWVVSLYSRKHGENPWIEILDFCEATGHSTDELVHELNFALYDG